MPRASSVVSSPQPVRNAADRIRRVVPMLLANVLAALVGGVLAVTGVIKFREGRDVLTASILAYKIVPGGCIRPLAASLPPTELAVGLSLVLVLPGPWPWFAIAILGMYTVAVISVIVRRMTTECGCFGSVFRTQANWVVVVRNVAMMLMLLPAAVLGVSHSVLWWAGWVLLGVAGLVAVIRLFPRRRLPPSGPYPASPSTAAALHAPHS